MAKLKKVPVPKAKKEYQKLSSTARYYGRSIKHTKKALNYTPFGKLLQTPQAKRLVR